MTKNINNRARARQHSLLQITFANLALVKRIEEQVSPNSLSSVLKLTTYQAFFAICRNLRTAGTNNWRTTQEWRKSWPRCRIIPFSGRMRAGGWNVEFLTKVLPWTYLCYPFSMSRIGWESRKFGTAWKVRQKKKFLISHTISKSKLTEIGRASCRERV